MAPVPPSFDRARPDEPEDIAFAFVGDYEDWNDFANASYAAKQDFGPATDSYDALIAKYCRPGKERQNLSFSSQSAHSQIGFEVLAVKGKGDRRKVKIRQTEATGYQPIYEFDFIREDGLWFLDELYFVDVEARNRRLRCL
jgi:hypothetical protein